MGSGPRIAVDAMGGDVGPEVMVAGAARAWRRRKARAAPATITSGPTSPPIASIAIRGPLPTYAVSRKPFVTLSLDRPDFTPVIVAAGGAKIVREMELAAILAFLVVDRLQRMMAAAHVALRRRSFSLGDGHPGTCS